MCVCMNERLEARPRLLLEEAEGLDDNDKRQSTPSPPTKSFPTKSPRVELSGRLPMKLYGHENSHP